MARGIVGIDHTLVGVADLERARETFVRLGFTATPRGRHIGWGTANYCLMFERGYVELLGIVDPSKYTAGLDAALAEQGEGLIGLALAADDAGAARDGLAAAGLDPGEVESLARDLELPEGTVRPRFALVHLPPGATPGGRMFVCHHLTPELIRRPEWLRHENGARALVAVTVVVDSPAAVVAPCRALFGTANVSADESGLTVRVGREAIRYVAPKGEADVGRASPRMAAMRFAVADAEATARFFAGRGVPFTRAADGSLRVAAAEACGAGLEFAPDR